jgi:hypothetical protein
MYAIIQNGIVINVVAWDGGPDWSPPEGATAVLVEEGQSPQIGYGYANGVFAQPPATNTP